MADEKARSGETPAHLIGVLNGNIDRVEIWNPSVYADTVTAASGNDLTRAAHRLFG